MTNSRTDPHMSTTYPQSTAGRGARCAPAASEPADHDEFDGDPTPSPPHQLVASVELVPPPEPATPGGGTSDHHGFRGESHYATWSRPSCRNTVLAFRVLNRLGHIGQTLNPLTYLALGLLVTMVLLASSPIGVHTGPLRFAQAGELAADPSAFTMLSRYLQWFWHNAAALALLGLQLHS